MERISGFLQIFVCRRGGKFSRKGAPTAAAEADGGDVLICQTAEVQPITYFEKQNAFGDFFVRTTVPDSRAEAGALWAIGRRESR